MCTCVLPSLCLWISWLSHPYTPDCQGCAEHRIVWKPNFLLLSQGYVTMSYQVGKDLAGKIMFFFVSPLVLWVMWRLTGSASVKRVGRSAPAFLYFMGEAIFCPFGHVYWGFSLSLNMKFWRCLDFWALSVGGLTFRHSDLLPPPNHYLPPLIYMLSESKGSRGASTLVLCVPSPTSPGSPRAVMSRGKQLGTGLEAGQPASATAPPARLPYPLIGCWLGHVTRQAGMCCCDWHGWGGDGMEAVTGTVMG